MSGINGDKSRHQINRKRVVLRREKIRKLVEASKEKGAASSPSTARSRSEVSRTRRASDRIPLRAT